MSATIAAPVDHFDRLFENDADPWGYRTRWYEERKRAVTLAALPRARFARAYEPGCAAGELSVALAARCDVLLSTDASSAAVGHARRRVAGAGLSHLTIDCATAPHDWPDGRFDLVVVSELGYYLDDDALSLLIQRSVEALTADGVLLACHWRHPVADFRRSGDAVHERFARECGLVRTVHHEEADFMLDVWGRDATSVARREGLA